MSEFTRVLGFEDVWLPVALPRRTPETVLRPASASSVRQRLTRIVSRAPEVMVKITGRTRDGGHLKGHLDYISRNGGLDLEDSEGAMLRGRREVAELAKDWAQLAEVDPRRRANTPFSLSMVLSMPRQTDPFGLRDAARAFATATFAERFDYVMALHTDTDHPHVHLTVRALGKAGERLNPKKADLQAWRESFAQALRDHGIEAEATPRRTRGVTRKAERPAIRRLRERAQRGESGPARVIRSAYQEAARSLVREADEPTPWERHLVERQAAIRRLYLRQAAVLQRSSEASDRQLGAKVEAFVRNMPPAESQRLALARELRAASAHRDRAQEEERHRSR